MSMYFECELNKIDIDEVLSTVRYIEPEDLMVLYREKIRRLESALKNSEDNNIRRSEMNKELSDKVECLGNNNRELLKENGRLKEELQLVCENYNAFNEDAKQLVEERDALWDETQYLDKIYKQLLNEKKRLQENFEELKASSDLSMTAELAEIFAEFIDKHDKNRDDLSVKIDEFREKYQSE